MKIQIEKPLLKSLALMASVIEARDAYTGGHLWRVSQYSQRLAEAAGMPMEMAFLSRLGGFLHDIGKIGIPDVILGKRGKLTEPEYEVVKTHPGIGATLIQEHPLGDLALSAVHQHHEWVNGQGYPGRLQGDQISIFARIVSIADAFDALTSTRPYRKGVAAGPAVEALKAEHGSQFDARLLDAFIELVRLDSLQEIVGTSERGVRMVVCPTCGPVITVSGNARDGDIGYCRICGARHRLHRDGDTFVAEPTGAKGTAEDLKPRPETRSIDAFVSRAPQWVDI
ncbi:HD domain-containing phosphohydrolase [uncultured Desulfosarcina sp.]|uniref:HD domain-containing phosphohydrolase n=1 Tax=uncultured Desulfosarcina sp. TaxID=218289 RepID=UPI0029C69171|nr:HD domain-containing phosphohydrolase [uncultured Desulfosarcina sp.]